MSIPSQVCFLHLENVKSKKKIFQKSWFSGQGSGALFSNPRWFVLCTFGDAYREQGYDHLYHFIASTKALRCYDDDFTKLTNVRSPATICGICIIPGDPHSPPPKLCALTYYTKRGPNDTEQVIYQLEKFDISGGQMKNRSEKKQIKFLIELNNDTLTTNITQIECWGNQVNNYFKISLYTFKLYVFWVFVFLFPVC